MRRASLILGILVMGAGLAPRSAQAGPLTMSSSMSVQCVANVGGSCSMLRFVLGVAGSPDINSIGIYNATPSLFNFANVQSVTDANGQNMNWWTTVLNGSSAQLALGAGQPAMQPIYVTMNLAASSTGTAQQLSQGGFTYAGSGTFQNQLVTFSGTATMTPEPITLALLGSGLAGIGGVGLVRRRKTRVEGD